MKRITLVLTLIFPAAVLMHPQNSVAEGVYKWIDQSGVTHYSSKPLTKDAKRAELPPIMRGEAKGVAQKIISCQQHGGINCQAGADSDGSVICYDGFKDATARYRFSCNSPKLEITDISDLMPTGDFTVFIRNSRGVEAGHPAVLFKREGGKEVKLKGPDKIEPFGVGEFTYEADLAHPLKGKAGYAELRVTCSNCPN